MSDEDDIKRETGQSVYTDDPYKIRERLYRESKDRVESIFEESGYGGITGVISKNYSGFNHRGFGSPLPMNKDQYGLIFFTRPDLNLSYDNLSGHRIFSDLLTDRSESVPRAVRCYLDPTGNRRSYDGFKCEHVDENSPFINLLSNTLISVSGWPDPTLDTYTSRAGIKKEAWSMIDGTWRLFGEFDLNFNFKNMPGDPITRLFNTWCAYGSMVYEGILNPYAVNIIDNCIDYQTRVYRFTLDPTRTYVQKVAAIGAGFPVAITLGAHFNYNRDSVFNTDVDQISLPMRCMGVDYLDPITIHEFNDLVVMFNRQFGDDNRYLYYKKLVGREKVIFDLDRTIPRVNPETMEMEWWVGEERYEKVIRRHLNSI